MTVFQIIKIYLSEHGLEMFCAEDCRYCMNSDEKRSARNFIACKPVSRLNLPKDTGRTPIEIVKEYLDLQGYDGLFTGLDSNEPCGCKKDDLAPCGHMWLWCHPGYYQESGDGEWGIGMEKVTEHVEHTALFMGIYEELSTKSKMNDPPRNGQD